MARRSFRNLLRMFGAAQIDDQIRGADVSEDVQLTYLVDDFRESTVAYAGAGATEGAVVAEAGALQLDARNPRGLIVETCQIVQVPAFGNEATILATTAAGLTLTGAASPPRVLQSGPLPDAALRVGTIALPANSFRWLSIESGGLRGFHLANGQTLTVVFGTVNVATAMGIWWRELSRA